MLKERLNLIINNLGLSGRKFEKECGLAVGSYASITDGTGADKLRKILIRYPQFSAEWLLTGDGEMLKPQQKIENTIENYVGFNYEDLLKQLQGLLQTNQDIAAASKDTSETNRILAESNADLIRQIGKLTELVSKDRIPSSDIRDTKIPIASDVGHKYGKK